MAEDVNLELSVNIQNAMASLKKVNDALIGIEKAGMEAGKRMDASFQKVSNNARKAGADVGKLKTEFAAPAGMIEKLEAKLNSLYVARKKAFNVADIRAYNAEIKKTEAEMRNLTATAQQSNNVFSQIKNQIAGAFAVGAIVNFARESVNAFAEAERGAKLLKFALNNNEKALATLDKQAQKYKETGLYDDDDITKGQVFLAQQGRTEEQIRKTIDAAVALSVTTGDDLMTSVEKLDATMEGNIGRLGKMDSRFKDLTDAQLANGAAIDLVTEKYGKNVDAMTNTTEAKMGKISNLWGDLQEAVGEKLVGAYDKIDTKNKDFWTSAGDIATLYSQVLLGPIDNIITKTVEWTVGIDEAEVRLRAFTGTASLAADGINNLAKAMMWTQQDDINNLMSQQLGAIEMAKKIKEQMQNTDAYKSGLKSYTEEFNRFLQTIAPSFVKMTDDIGEQVNELLVNKIAFENQLSDITLNIEKRNRAAILEQQKLASKKSLEEQIKFLEEEKNIKLSYEQLTQEERNLIIQKYYDEVAKITKTFEEKQKQDRIDAISATIDGISQLYNAFYQFQQQKTDEQTNRLKESYDRQAKMLDDQLNRGIISREVYDKRKEQLDKNREAKEREINRRAFEQKRKADLVFASMEEAKAIIALTAALAGTGNPLAPIIAAGIGAAVGALNMALILAAKNPYAKGGMIDGKSHSAGGEYIWAEGGEAVLNKRSMSNPVLKGFASAINEIGGGKSFSSKSGMFADIIEAIALNPQAFENSMKTVNVNASVALDEGGKIDKLVNYLEKQGGKQIYVDKNGNRIEIIGNRKKIYRA